MAGRLVRAGSSASNAGVDLQDHARRHRRSPPGCRTAAPGGAPDPTGPRRSASAPSGTGSPHPRRCRRSAERRRGRPDPRHRAVPSTTWCHCANDRRGDRVEGSSPTRCGSNGLPPQVTVRTRSGRSQTRYSPGMVDTGTASRPLAIGVSAANCRRVLAERGGGDQPRARLRVQPRADLAQRRGARHLADTAHLALEQQRRTGGAKRLQQRRGPVEQRVAPVALARDRADHPLLQPAHRELGLRLDEAFQRGDARRHRFGQQFADRAFLEMNEARARSGGRTPGPTACR